MLRGTDCVVEGQLEIIGDARISRDLKRVDHHGIPGNGATSLDRAFAVRVAGGLLAGRESAVVVNVKAADARAMMQESAPVTVVARDAPHFGQPLNCVQAFPA